MYTIRNLRFSPQGTLSSMEVQQRPWDIRPAVITMSSRFLLGGLWPGQQLPVLAVIFSGKMPGLVSHISPHSSVAIFVTLLF